MQALFQCNKLSPRRQCPFVNVLHSRPGLSIQVQVRAELGGQSLGGRSLFAPGPSVAPPFLPEEFEGWRTLSLITSGTLAKCSLSAGKSVGEMPNHGDLIASLPLPQALARQPAWLLQTRCPLSPCPCTSALALTAGLLQQISLLHQAAAGFRPWPLLAPFCVQGRGLTRFLLLHQQEAVTRWEGEKRGRGRTFS